MVRIYGTREGFVRIEGSTYEETAIRCDGKALLVDFVDGATMRVSRTSFGVWRIREERRGTAPRLITPCGDPAAEDHSDVLEIAAEVRRHRLEHR